MLIDSDLSAQHKEVVFYDIVSDSWYDDVETFKKSGGNIDMFALAYLATRGITGDKKDGKTVYLSKSKNLKAAIDAVIPKASKAEREALYTIFDVSKKVW